MCGLAGFLRASEAGKQFEWTAVVRSMGQKLAHRGPDDHGEWSDPKNGIALAHRRLSILDLSPEGHQPMASASGRYVMVFNGEVYNFREIRSKLAREAHPSPKYRGHSDTEVMLAAIERWSVQKAVKQFNGIFAFALWDRCDRILHLVRDRFGIKPLYYGWVRDTLVFASELKSIAAYPEFQGEINRQALDRFLRLQYIPAPETIYTGIYKLPPGTLLSVPGGDAKFRSGFQPECGGKGEGNRPIPYWSAQDIFRQGQASPATMGPQECLPVLESLLTDAVSLQMVADVPLGAFLSGGVDSSLVVALMQASSPRPVKTFTIGFRESEFNESHHAKHVAAHLGTQHHELLVTPDDALGVVQDLPRLYDEPFADMSQIPTFLLCRLTRQYVTVSLSGDGGDELFLGYNRYTLGNAYTRRLGPLPSFLQRLLASLLVVLPANLWETRIPTRFRPSHPHQKILKLVDVLRYHGQYGLYDSIMSQWKDVGRLVVGSTEGVSRRASGTKGGNAADPILEMNLRDILDYLPEDILTKVDRASMGVGLEARVPLLDHRVFEFSARLPQSIKTLDGRGKWPLRQLLYNYVPRELVERPKKGFEVPIGDWLRGPLRGWAEDLLSEASLKDGQFFFTVPIRRKWQEHLEGRRNWTQELWNVLMFQAWYYYAC